MADGGQVSAKQSDERGTGPDGLQVGFESRGLALPISREGLLTTNDLDQIRAEMTRAISHHIANPEPGVRKISASKSEARLGDFGLIQIGYGAQVSINAETCGPHMLVQTPLSGYASIRNGKDVVDSHTGMATIIRPGVPLDFRFSADFNLLVLRLSAERLERHCAQLLSERGSCLDRPLSFALGLSLEGEAGERWRRLLRYLWDEAVGAGSSLLRHSPLAMASFDQMLMNTLLSVQPHNYTDALFGRPACAAPFYVRRAEDYIRAHAAEPLTLTDIADAAGISARTLHRTFQSFRGTSPLAWLKAVRLQHVHDELIAGEPSTISVTDVALKWGFGHLGHFGQDYKHRFGETPIETLRRCR